MADLNAPLSASAAQPPGPILHMERRNVSFPCKLTHSSTQELVGLKYRNNFIQEILGSSVLKVLDLIGQAEDRSTVLKRASVHGVELGTFFTDEYANVDVVVLIVEKNLACAQSGGERVRTSVFNDGAPK